MSISAILIQVAVSLLVVGFYHLWVSRKQRLSAKPLPVVATSTIAPLKASLAAEPIPPEILAVIAASIAVVLGQSHRVLSVQQATAHMPEVNIWAMEGRMEQFMSHKIR
jgi:hypothetical protein